MSRRAAPASVVAVALLHAVVAGCSAGRVEVITLAPESLRLGMLAHWACDEGSGGKLLDRSGNGHEGILFGASWIPGHFGGALHLDAGAWVNVPEFPQASSSWSVALWYRAPSVGFVDGAVTLLGNEQTLAGGWAMAAKPASSGGQYRFEYPLGATGTVYVETDRVAMGSWVHLAAVVDGDSRALSLFENGELVGMSSLTLPIAPGSNNLLLGHGTDNRYPLVGDLDDIVVFNRALIAAEVHELGTAAAPDPR